MGCGIYIASVYLHDSEGGTQRNLELLVGVLGRLQVTRCPWLVGLDAQEEPDALLRWAGPLSFQVQGIASNMTTSFVEESLAKTIKKVGTLSEFRCRSVNNGYTVSAGPHRLVWASFHNTGMERLQWALHTPRKFEKVKPCGCARAPVAAQLIGEEEKRVLANGSSGERSMRLEN